MRITVHDSSILLPIGPGIANSGRGRRVLLPYIDPYIYASQMETRGAETYNLCHGIRALLLYYLIILYRGL